MKKQRVDPSQYVIFSKNLPWRIRLRDVLLTIVIWAMYFYFMRDFGSFVRDATIWISHGYDDPSQYPGLKILPSVAAFFEITAALVSLLIGWSYYNLIRYGKKNRRKPAPPVTVEQAADYFRVDPAALGSWRKMRIMTMYLDKNGHAYKVVGEG